MFGSGKNKKTLYEQLITASRATGIIQEKLANPPAILPEFLHVWKWFVDVNRTRSSGFQLEAVSYQEVVAYFFAMKINASPVEIEVLNMIDDQYLAVARKVAEV